MGNKFPALKIAMPCSLVLLAKVGWRQGKALGRQAVSGGKWTVGVGSRGDTLGTLS